MALENEKSIKELLKVKINAAIIDRNPFIEPLTKGLP